MKLLVAVLPHLRHILEESHAHFDPRKQVQKRQKGKLSAVKHYQQKQDTRKGHSESYG